MLLTTAGFLTTLGFAAWILGILLGHREVAVIGGTLVLGVGAMMTAQGGLEHQVGSVEYTNADNQTVTEYEYEQIETPAHLPLDWLVMLLGGVFIIHALNNESVT